MKTHPDNIVSPESVNLGDIAIINYNGAKHEGFVDSISRSKLSIAVPVPIIKGYSRSSCVLSVPWKDVLEISKPG